jgi:hypothetical protein
MKPLWLLFSLFCLQEEVVPYKAKEDFEIKLNFEFKQRPPADPYQVNLDETRREYERRNTPGPLPYLYLNLHIAKITPGETKIRLIRNNDENAFTKKLQEGMQVKLDLGFTDDIKDRVSAHEYTLHFLSQDKKPLSRIVIFFEEDGTYLVNGEKRGKL